jgi:hypothetical protein
VVAPAKVAATSLVGRPSRNGSGIVFHSWDFPFPISWDPDDFAIPAFPGNRSGIPGNRIY